MNFRDFVLFLWRFLPKTPRQKLSEYIWGRLPPPIADVPRARVLERDVPRIVVGFLSSPSGLGQSARLAAKALQLGGHDVYGIDLSNYFHEKTDVIDHGLRDGKSVAGSAHILININAPYLPYALSLLGREFLKNKYITGYWAWELPRLPASWQKGFGCVHDVAVPSQFVADAVRHMNSDIDVYVAPHPVSVDNFGPAHEAGENPHDGNPTFTVANIFSVGSGFERKNPLALIKAFRLAFSDRGDCRLRMLISNAEHFPPARTAIAKAIGQAENIEIKWGPLAESEFRDWWGRPDLYAALHRSEGFGLPLAEAMCAGIPAVATGWSGNLEFMNAENACLVKFRLSDVYDSQKKYSDGCGQWADADIKHAADLFKELEKDREKLHRLGAVARTTCRKRLSADEFCSALFPEMPFIQSTRDDHT